MSVGIKNRANLVLALLYTGESPGNTVAQRSTPIKGITRLEKLLFLLKKETRLLDNVQQTDDFHFTAFRMGPWTQEVYDEIDFLESLGLTAKQSRGETSSIDAAHNDELFSQTVLGKYQKSDIPSSEMETFVLTSAGMDKAKKIWDNLPNDEKKALIGIKSKFNNMNLKQFLRYVYNKYPEYTTASEIKEYLGIKEKKE